MGVPAAITPAPPPIVEVAAAEGADACVPPAAAAGLDEPRGAPPTVPMCSGDGSGGEGLVEGALAAGAGSAAPPPGGAAGGNADGGLSAACLLGAPVLLGEALWESCRAELASAWECGSHRGDSLVILDWDDTLLPTAALCQGGHFAPPQDELAQRLAELMLWNCRDELAACAAACAGVLAAAKRHGAVAIVTNALNGWVRETAARFMPQLVEELEGVPVISARSIFEPMGFANPWDWKCMCFERIGRCVPWGPAGAAGARSLVSIGDSWYERAAAIKAVSDLALPCYLKCMKLVEQPTMPQLVQQLEQIGAQFDWVAAHEGPLDLWFPLCCPAPAAEPAAPAGGAAAGGAELAENLPPPPLAPPPPAPPAPLAEPPAADPPAAAAWEGPGADEAESAAEPSEANSPLARKGEELERCPSVGSVATTPTDEALAHRSFSDDSMESGRTEVMGRSLSVDSVGSAGVEVTGAREYVYEPSADEVFDSVWAKAVKGKANVLDESFSDASAEGDAPRAAPPSVGPSAACRPPPPPPGPAGPAGACEPEQPMGAPGAEADPGRCADAAAAEEPAPGGAEGPAAAEALGEGAVGGQASGAEPRPAAAAGAPCHAGPARSKSQQGPRKPEPAARRRKSVAHARVFTRRSPCASKRTVRTDAC